MRLKIWEIALIVALAAALLGGTALAREQTELASKLIRLHVVPNSDAKEDQELKIAVRDTVLDVTQPLLKGVASREKAQAVLEKNLDAIAAAAEKTIRKAGFAYPVRVGLETESLPTRRYETFALPAGEYLTLRVTIGEGSGGNWWCVIYPPLCMTAAQAEEAFADLTEEEVRLITEDSPPYVVKFKVIEIIQSIREYLEEKGIL